MNIYNETITRLLELQPNLASEFLNIKEGDWEHLYEVLNNLVNFKSLVESEYSKELNSLIVIYNHGMIADMAEEYNIPFLD